MNKVKILIIDSNLFFRAGIKQILSGEPELEVIESSPNGELTRLIEAEYPDVILLDCGSSPTSLALGKKIIQRYPNIRFIMLSLNPDDTELFNVVKIGAVAYLDKNCDPKEMISTIRKSCQGKYPINDSIFSRPKVAEQVLQEFQKLSSQKAAEIITAPITQRETQILSYICNGDSNKQIAELLNISEQTIKNYVSSILRKLNANDRAHAAILAVRRGLISLQDLQ